jgi:hypothetical protein
MLKKQPHYMMLSGWLPIPYSQWNNIEYNMTGRTDNLTADEFYAAAKIIADGINDKQSKNKIKKNIEKDLKDSGLMICMPFRFDSYFEEIFTMVNESYEIHQYIIKNYV